MTGTKIRAKLPGLFWGYPDGDTGNIVDPAEPPTGYILADERDEDGYYYLRSAAGGGGTGDEGIGGKCGENLTWTLKDGVLTIRGTGLMANYDWPDQNPVPWFDYREEIKTVIIEDGVTSIDGSAFDECNKLTDIYYWGSKEQWNATEFSQTDFAAGLNIYCEGEMI